MGFPESRRVAGIEGLITRAINRGGHSGRLIARPYQHTLRMHNYVNISYGSFGRP